MPRFAANLSWLYDELPLIDRFAQAARDGFLGVECLFPYDHDRAALRGELDEYGLEWVLLNAPPGDWAAGDRGLAARPGREAEFQHGIEQALDWAQALGSRRVHVMAGLSQPHENADALWALYQRNLDWAARQAAGCGVTLLVEPINPIDMPGYLLTRQAAAHRLVSEIGAPNLMVQMDLYHCQLVEGEVTGWLTGALRPDAPGAASRVGHMQVAGVPGRHEPVSDVIDYPSVFELIDQLGYTGWIGCEYRPRMAPAAGATTAGLGWMAGYLQQQRFERAEAAS
ncbi:MAG: TIM barrel protein [Burkholderiales bacterium]|nr:TIM barrel protein [Burkholderiales bacterium]